MRISRLYVQAALSEGTDIALDPESAHYARDVLRLRKGFDLVIFNGEGGEYTARVLEIHKEAVRVAVGTFDPHECESPLFTHLGLGISRGERMDLAIQKAVELGVSKITPLLTERVVVQLDESRTEQRLGHWRRIVRSACEQCGRNRLPDLEEPQKLRDWVGQQSGLCLLLDPHGGRSLAEFDRMDGRVSLLSGPEGGFSDAEREAAKAASFRPWRLGPRVLRTETAALAALAALQAQWGDFGSAG